MCIHLQNGNVSSAGGYSCRDATSIFDATWEWLIYHRD